MAFCAPTAAPISATERRQRLDALARKLSASGIEALLVGASESLRYFTGLVWSPSERFSGALIHDDGTVDLICPRFEREKFEQMVAEDGCIGGDIYTWEEEHDPHALIASRLSVSGKLAVDEQLAAFTLFGLNRTLGHQRIVTGGPIITAMRSLKSPAEIAILQRAKSITLEVQKRAHAQLYKGTRASEIVAFIDAEHRKLAGHGSYFCIVSFGVDTSLPHGGSGDPALQSGDVVLIDTGTEIDGYHSDITRTYVFGDPTPAFARVWQDEQDAQRAAFNAARLGATCESVDAAARDLLTARGYGPDYQLPGLPHRTGHGIGLDIHESPNLVRGDRTPLQAGMCFSNEPMIVIPGQFGVRLEDHFYMTEDGPRWFTQPSFSLEQPFGEAA